MRYKELPESVNIIDRRYENISSALPEGVRTTKGIQSDAAAGKSDREQEINRTYKTDRGSPNSGGLTNEVADYYQKHVSRKAK